MLEFQRLRIRGIGRLVEEQVIDFTTLGKFVQFAGLNKNTGGSSAAGKSTVFNAIEWLFGINKVPSTVLKSRYSDDPPYVQGEFLLDGKPLTITRHKKLVIDFHDGSPTTGSSAVSEEKLESIMGMAGDLFRPMLHKRQKEGGFFLNMVPSIMNSFLMNCLGLGHYKEKFQKVDADIARFTEARDKFQGLLEASRAGLKATESAITSLGLPPAREMSQETVLGLKIKYEKSSGELGFWLEVQKKDLASLEEQRPQITGIAFDRAALVALEKEYDSIQKQMNALKDSEKSRQHKATLEAMRMEGEVTKAFNLIAKGDEFLKKAKEVAEQLKNIKDGKCYTCRQPYIMPGREEALKASIPALREHIAAGQKAKEELESINKKREEAIADTVPREIPEIQPLGIQLTMIGVNLTAEREKEKQHQSSEMVKNREAQNKFAALQSALRERHEKESGQLRGQADIDRRAFDAAVGALKASIEAIARYERSSSALKTQQEAYSKEITEDEAKLAYEIDRLAVAEELKRGMKSHLSCSFDDALETIGENATTMIRHIPNMANATIQLHGTKETKDGKVKEEVNAVIHMDGEEGIPVLSLCGGERTALDLAIDLSVIDLIETRANKGIDIFILDEPFNGLDTVCIEMALEVLKNSNVNKRLIIVDHNPEVRQMVESSLTVVRDGATSRIIQAA